MTTVLDCKMTVNTMPIAMLMSLLEVWSSSSVRNSDSLSGAIEELTKSRLKKINPKKKIPFPKTLNLNGIREIKVPKTIKIGPIPVSLKETSHAVAVVPTYEPSMIATEPAKDKIPLSTIDTAKDETAVEDWMMTVKINPTKKETNLLAVNFFMIASSLFPAAIFSSVEKELRPYKKSMMALMIENII